MLDQLAIRENIAKHFLSEASRYLLSQEPDKRNTGGIVIAGTAASFLSNLNLFQEFSQIWNTTHRKGQEENKTLEEMIPFHVKDCYLISREKLIENLQNMAPERIELCSRKDITINKALQTAKSQLDIEEIGCTFAVIGQYIMAQKIAKETRLDNFRQQNITWIIETERLREGDLSNLNFEILGLHDWGASPWQAGHVALCALGRQPWLGYPYPDW